jgi:CDP-glucose 4,6-dehydratase
MEMLVTPKAVLEHYRGKRVFVTGHTGFKGSWLSLLLAKSGAMLKGYALTPDETQRLFTDLEPSLGMVSVLADIRDTGRLQRELLEFAPDFVFHLAAQPLVRYSYLHPAETFDVNVMGTVNLLEAVRKLNRKCTVVVITTDKVYENNEAGLPFGEADPLGGHDPYSSSKACAEIVVQSYRKSFFPSSAYLAHGKGIATARAGNVIGGGDWSTDRIFPDLVRSMEAGKELVVRNPDAIRPWQHVLDPLTGYLRLAMLLEQDPARYEGCYNFGPQPDDTLTVEELVQAALKHWGSGSYQKPNASDAFHEANSLRLDISHALNHLHWNPKWDARTAVERTVRWYKSAHESNKSAEMCCMDDISEYTS